MIKTVNLTRLFKPNSLAIIGASYRVNIGGGFLWNTVISQGYEGKAFAVNPKYTAINGFPCYPSILDIDEPLDLAIIAVPAVMVENILYECSQKGVRFAVIFTAGFAEFSESGKELQKRVLNIARRTGIRIVGPNCMGIACPETKLNSVVGINAEDFLPGTIAFCGQSGWATENFLVDGTARGLRVSKIVSCGNQMDLNLIDYLSYFNHDNDIKLIGAYVEGISHGKELLKLAKEINYYKPIVLYKSGFSKGGSRAALSHAASITGNKEVWLGAAHSSGIVVAEELEEVVDILATMSAPVWMKGIRVGLITESGAAGVVAADAFETYGMKINSFSFELTTQLENYLGKYLPPFSGIRNPLDLVWLPKEKATPIYQQCIQLIAKEVDLLVIMPYQPFEFEQLRPVYIELFTQLRDQLDLPIYLVSPYASNGFLGIKEFTLAGLPAFPTFIKAAKALQKVWYYNNWRSNEQ